MFSHADLWRGLDSLARLQGCSLSALARRAGLDATAFNPSKRFTADGRPRWLSTESLSKVLDVTGTSLSAFAALVEPALTQVNSASTQTALPCLDMERIHHDIPFDDEGLPAGVGWDLLPFPTATDPSCFAIELTDDDFPSYPAGTHLIVSPAGALATTVRRGDRLVLGLIDDEILLGDLIRQSPRRLDVMPLTRALEETPSQTQRTVERAAIRWMGRVIWASQ